MKDGQLLRDKILEILEKYHVSFDSAFAIADDIIAIEEQEPTPDLDCGIYLAECIKKAEPNLSKIKDVDQELAEIRGISQITDSDIEAWARETSTCKIDEVWTEEIDIRYREGLADGAKLMRDNEIKHIK
jgi:hypothetical protein